MPSSISSPGNSFVRFNIGKYLYDNNCYQDPVNKCLPVKDLSDVQFQFYMPNIVKPTGLAKYYVIPGTVGEVEDLLCENVPFEYFKIGDPSLGCLNGQFLPETFNLFEPITDAEPTNLANILLENWNTFSLPNEIKEGDCFRFIIVQSDLSSIEGCVANSYVIGCSNCFWRMPADEICDTSKVIYKNNENSFGFNYEDKISSLVQEFKNIIRLPFYLYAPQFPSEVKGYQKSDGKYLKLSERINEEWQLITDYMVREWHVRLKIALAHDELEIVNDNRGGSGIFYCDADYAIEWNEDERIIDATATTTLKLSEANNRINSNCK